MGFEVSDDVRWVLFMYATKVKGITCRELGITSAMGNMIKNRRRRVSDEVLEKLLAKLTAKDLLEVVKSIKAGGGSVSRGPSSSWLGRRPDAASQLVDLL
ncbi:MAG: hypothetical protein QXZ56_04165, partial [Sulfolobales archaeon]